jgi:protease I
MVDPRVLYIIAQEGFRDEEFFIPKKILEDNGIAVVTASITTETAKSKFGKQVQPDIAVKDADLDDYDMIILAGGPGTPALQEHEEVESLFIGARERDLPFAAICVAPMLLAEYGVLEDKRVTVFPDDEAIETLKEGGATYTGSEVEIDGNVITANGPEASDKFGKAILKLLKNLKK